MSEGCVHAQPIDRSIACPCHPANDARGAQHAIVVDSNACDGTDCFGAPGSRPGMQKARVKREQK